MEQTYLIFGHRGARFGLDVRAVREMVWLPELSPIEELPPYIVGVFNLRGRVVPVMDLALRFGRAPTPFLSSDQVIVVGCDETRVGVVANELLDVAAIPQAAIADADSYQAVGGHRQFVLGGARLDDGLAMLLDVNALLHSAPAAGTLTVPALAYSGEQPSALIGTQSPAEADLLRSRAARLAQAESSGERAELQTFAVIRLDAELFAIGLDLVREFSHARSITPLPCSPRHVIGNMNLRGEILTLLDLRPTLGAATEGALCEVVVLRIGELTVGLAAEEIVDVADLAPSDISAVPVGSDPAAKAYCSGVAALAGRPLGILDLKRIIADLEPRLAEQEQ